MRLHRFFGDFDLAPTPNLVWGLKQKSLQISDRDFLHQTRDVLRLKKGEEIILVDGRGQEAEAKIIEYNKDFVAVEVLAIKQNQNEPGRRVLLYCSILKREHFELVAQKATEVRASEIVPIICQYTVKTGLKYDRLRKIIKEAAEQSGRGILPILHEALIFSEAVKEAENNNINLFFDRRGEKFTTCHVVNLKKNKIGVFIGPEGGWSKEEIAAAKKAGFKIASLGKLTLRAESAAIVAVYLASGN